MLNRLKTFLSNFRLALLFFFGVLILFDLFGKSSDLRIFFLILGVVILGFIFNVKGSLYVQGALGSLLTAMLFLLVNMNSVADTLSVWSFFLLVIGSINLLWEFVKR